MNEERGHKLKENPKLSVVLPIHNEEENLPVLFDRLRVVLKRMQISFELVFVDDASTDKSFDVLSGFYEKHPGVIQVVRLSRNFGQQVAVVAGIEKAEGDSIVVMDSDLQDLPEEIPKLYEKL